MVEQMTPAQLLDLVRRAWTAWQAALANVEISQMEHPHIGEWSIKDLVVHITWSEKEVLGMLKERSMALASPHWELTPTERNQAIYEEHRHRALQEVLSEAQDVHEALMVELQKLSDADLVDPARYAGMPPEWVPWQMIAGCTYRHYAEHTQDLEK